MRLVGVIGTAILVSGLAVTLPAYSQRGDQDNNQGRHKDHAEHGRPGRAEKHPGPPQRAREHVVEQHGPEHAAYVQHAPRHVEPRPAQHVVWQQYRATRWTNEHRNWQQRGGYHGYRIPHARYVVYFGREHSFRLHALPVVVVENHPRFQYHDYWVTLVDPIPESWSASWYDTDDVYVEYAHDGYYMHNTRHPGVALAINVSF